MHNFEQTDNVGDITVQRPNYVQNTPMETYLNEGSFCTYGHHSSVTQAGSELTNMCAQQTLSISIEKKNPADFVLNTLKLIQTAVFNLDRIGSSIKEVVVFSTGC